MQYKVKVNESKSFNNKLGFRKVQVYQSIIIIQCSKYASHHCLCFCFRTGSFTSAPKAIPAAAADANDDDVYYPAGREDLNQFLQRCSQQLQGLPAPIPRRWRKTPKYYCDKSKILYFLISFYIQI